MFILFLLSFLQAQIEGRWITGDGKGLIEIKKEGEFYIGIAKDGVPDEKTKGFDIYNPDKSLRDRTMKDVTIMTGLKKEDNEYVGGRIYDPNSGNTYMCKIEVLNKDKIELRGYLLIPLFGRSDTWTRAPADFKGWHGPNEIPKK
jgi:uncharacterized protein (DUF2147 family)